MSDDPSLSPTAVAPEHPAPPSDERPRSRLAILALVLSVVLGVVAMGGLWVAVLPAIVLCAWALVRVRPQQVRGQGLVIIALVVCVVLGLVSFGFTNKARNAARNLAAGVMTALDTSPATTEGGTSDDPLDAWLSPAARETGAGETIRRRYAAVVDEVGPYRGEITLRSMLLGATAVMSPPLDAREIEGPEPDEGEPPQIAIWARASFRDARLHVALVIGDGGPEAMAEAIVQGGRTEATPLVSDVRFFFGD
ncbi:MAG: hypothetical protein ACYTG6_09610 [Planctomycetota bacterium]|jgi:hypothetical protein